eukprot:CFRG1644T1
MVLEATVVCVDNSEWMRNKDYPPSRLDAQRDAVHVVCSSKTRANAESTVSVMTIADTCEMLVTLTPDIGKILTSMHDVKLKGEVNILDGLQIAQLALKHRQNKNQRQRIVVFVGSPVKVDQKALTRVAKKLKKNNVAVDVINFGEEEENLELLEDFINNVNSREGNSHLVSIPAGTAMLSDHISKSPILRNSEEESYSGGDVGSSGGFEFGVDPTMDPELAMALRISMEEEQARQERARFESEGGEGGTATESGETDPVTPSESTAEPGAAVEIDEDQMLLEQALALSRGGFDDGAGDVIDSGDMDVSEMTEEDQIALAMQMSMAPNEETADADADAEMTDAMQNPEFLSSVLGSLPGVDPSDEALMSAMGLEKEKEKDDDEEK